MANPASALLKKKRKPKSVPITDTDLFLKNNPGGTRIPLASGTRQALPRGNPAAALIPAAPGEFDGPGAMPRTDRSRGLGQNQELFEKFRNQNDGTGPVNTPASSPNNGVGPINPNNVTSDQIKFAASGMTISSLADVDDVTSQDIQLAGTGPAPGNVEGGDLTKQDRLDRIWSSNPKTAGTPAPRATPEQEQRFQQRRAEAIEAKARQVNTISMSRVGDRHGRTLEVGSDTAGSPDARELTRKAGGMFGEDTGTQQITLGGRVHAIPAALNAEKVTETAESLRRATVGNKTVMSIEEAIKRAVDIEFQATGGRPGPATIRMQVGGDVPGVPERTEEIPIDKFLNDGLKTRAGIEATRTGTDVQANIPAGRKGKNLAVFMHPSVNSKDGLSIAMLQKDKKDARARVVQILGGARTSAEKKALKGALDAVDARFSLRGQRRRRTIRDIAQGTPTKEIRMAESSVRLANDKLQDTMLVAAREKLDNGGISRETRDAVQVAADGVEDAGKQVTTLRMQQAKVGDKILASMSKDVRKSLVKEDAGISKFLTNKVNRAQYDTIVKSVNDQLFGGATTGTGVNKIFAPNFGPEIKGRKHVGGELQRGTLDLEALETTWASLKARNSKHGLPDGLLAYAMNSILKSHPEFDKSIINSFYRKNAKDFQTARATTPATPANTGAKAFTNEELADAYVSKTMTPEMNRFYFQLSQADQVEITEIVRSRQ